MLVNCYYLFMQKLVGSKEIDEEILKLVESQVLAIVWTPVYLVLHQCSWCLFLPKFVTSLSQFLRPCLIPGKLLFTWDILSVKKNHFHVKKFSFLVWVLWFIVYLCVLMCLERSIFHNHQFRSRTCQDINFCFEQSLNFI